MSEFSRAKHHEFGFPREMEVIPYFLPDAPVDAVRIASRPVTDCSSLVLSYIIMTNPESF